MTDVAKTFHIGEYVHRVFPNGKCKSRDWREWDPDLCEPWPVERVTKQFIFVRDYLEPRPHDIRLTKCDLLARGITFSRAVTPGIFIVDLPEPYRRQTVGYMIKQKPRELLGLNESFSLSDLRDAHRDLVKKYHPDGSEPDVEMFRKIQNAYEILRKTLG